MENSFINKGKINVVGFSAGGNQSLPGQRQHRTGRDQTVAS